MTADIYELSADRRIDREIVLGAVKVCIKIKWLAGVQGAKLIIHMNVEEEVSEKFQEEINNQILKLAIDYALHDGYPEVLSKERNRAVRKRA